MPNIHVVVVFVDALLLVLLFLVVVVALVLVLVLVVVLVVVTALVLVTVLVLERVLEVVLAPSKGAGLKPQGGDANTEHRAHHWT